MSMRVFLSELTELEGLFAGIVFFATTALFVGATIAQVVGSGLVS